MARRPPVPPSELFEAALGGDRRALGRLLTLVERGGDPADEVTRLAHERAGRAHVVGLTGAPGAGKSTLTGRLVATAAASGARPAVVAVDPSSPLTGGAILGDRIRMDDVVGGDAFIRSIATRGHSGGLAVAVPGAVRVLDAVGYDPVIIETVGVGQVEVDVASTADTTVIVVTPGWGDAVQANKAGLLEVGDVFVVNKADRPGASDARRDLELMLDLGPGGGAAGHHGRRPPVLTTTATDGAGVDDLWQAVREHRAHLEATGELDERRSRRHRAEITSRVEGLLTRRVAEHLATDHGRAVLAAADEAEIDPAVAARRVVRQILGEPERA